MPRFKQEKHRLSAMLHHPEWQYAVAEELQTPEQIRVTISPFLSFLARPELRWQAAWALGKAVSTLALHDMEQARVIVRRIMWSLNEDSGNLGWGMPEAMGCILAESPALAREYGRILLTYIRDTGHADNYLDLADLRQGAYWAVGRFAETDPIAALPALSALAPGMLDTNIVCRGFAAYASAALADGLTQRRRAPTAEEAAAWRTIADSAASLSALPPVEIRIMEGAAILSRTLAQLGEHAREAALRLIG